MLGFDIVQVFTDVLKRKKKGIMKGEIKIGKPGWRDGIEFSGIDVTGS